MTDIQGTKKYGGPHKFLAETLRLLEMLAHRRGWKKDPPVLYRLFEVDIASTEDPEDGTKETTAHYAVSGYEFTDGRRVHDQLRSMAAILESPLAPLAMALFENEHDIAPKAHALLGEIYFHDDNEEYVLVKESGRGILDMPGTKFGRIVLCVIGDDCLIYRRVRGELPLWLPADSHQDPKGPFPLLARIHRADTEAWQSVFGDRS